VIGNDARRLAASVAILVLAACSNGGASATPQTDEGRSWMARDAKSQSLLYVSSYRTDNVYVFSYPRGRLVGTLAGFNGPDGECVDSAGNVWITNTLQSQLVEYAHGGTTSIATLNDPGEYPFGCSVDRKTGNLAVTNIYGAGSPSLASGNVVIYAGAKGSPQGPYYDSVMYYMYFCGFDRAGNLFLDGESYGGGFRLAELVNGSTGFTDLTLNKNIGQPGGVQWDGNHIAVGDQHAGIIYQLQIADSGATVVGSTPLNDSKDVVGFWIDGKTVVGPDAVRRDVGYWSYPSGGSPARIIRDRVLNQPIGAVVSAP
jgi:DNA-binding beta-propeller fold protein YncE